jgi:hypothetical protein
MARGDKMLAAAQSAGRRDLRDSDDELFEEPEALAPSLGFGDWDKQAREQKVPLTLSGVQLTQKGAAWALEMRSSHYSSWRRVFVVPNSLLYKTMTEVFDARSLAVDEPSHGVVRGLLAQSTLAERWGPRAKRG